MSDEAASATAQGLRTNFEGEAMEERSRKELVLRLRSALVLIIIALALTWAGVHAFAVLITLFIAGMSWEWGRLVRGGGLDVAFLLQLVATVAACWLTANGAVLAALLMVLAGTIAVFLYRIVKHERRQAWWSAAGVLYGGLPAIALVWIRADDHYGWLAVLYIFAIVWTTDSGAYAFGRMIGGPKLAPRVSPNKTWAGLLGGTLSAVFVAMLFALWLDGNAVSKLMLIGGGLALVAQFGDLAESGLKRRFGTKDSSSLIPGHGGVLDRIDGLVIAAVAAGMIACVIDPANPGRALLVL